MNQASKSITPAENMYQTITARVIDLLENVDLNNYEPPFASLASQGLPHNPTTKNKYNGINIPCLWFYQQECGFTSNHWASYKQWKEIGAHVKEGEKGSQVVFYKTLLITDKSNPIEPEEIKIPMLRLYKVFNANQVDGYHDETNSDSTIDDDVEPISWIDRFCNNSKVEIQHGGSKAYYSPLDDFIQMPKKEAFNSTLWATPTENYYSVLFHELVHSTGHENRLNRLSTISKNDLAAYAHEELVAELGSAFLSSQFNFAQTARDDHAMYIKSWLKILKNDNKFIFKASAQAGKAVDYLNSLQEASSPHDE